jgi:hypothetical protein
MSKDLYTRAMFGENAVHVPVWLKVQDMGPNGVLFVGASRLQDMRFKSNKSHQLIIGEIIVRPHVVVESNAFQGYGAQGLITECDLDKWISTGNIICDPMGKFK